MVAGILDEIKSVQSYAELSPSRSGAHVITFGTKRRQEPGSGRSMEMYDRGRFFTVTGDHIPGTPLDVREPAPGAWRRSTRRSAGRRRCSKRPGRRPDPRSTAAPDLTDAEIIEKCQSADNAAKFNAYGAGYVRIRIAL